MGRFNLTHRIEDRGAFKTPTLRELTSTAPYMHDGRFETLEAVVDYYDRGGSGGLGWTHASTRSAWQTTRKPSSSRSCARSPQYVRSPRRRCCRLECRVRTHVAPLTMGVPRTRVSRREFLGRLAAAGGTAIAAAACRKPTPDLVRGPPGRSLTAEELRSVGRLATASCLPTKTPAPFSWAVEYIDCRLAGTSRRLLQAKRRFRKGLAQLSAWSRERTGQSFWVLDPQTQDVTLASLAAEGARKAMPSCGSSRS